MYDLAKAVEVVSEGIIGTLCRIEEVLNGCGLDMSLVHDKDFMDALAERCFYCSECGFWLDSSWKSDFWDDTCRGCECDF